MDRVDKETRSKIMSNIRSISRIERVPEFLRAYNMRHQPKGIFGKPDFANKSRKVVLFIDGCYWHGCPEHYKESKTNVEFWRNKIARNRERDAEVTKRLESDGWVVHRIWECELKEMK